MAFLFQKPTTFAFTAGQYLDFTLIHPAETDAEGNKRTFSIASSPQESHLMIATRMRDTAFKRVLKNMSVGTPITISKPGGSFILHDDAAKPAVFLIGGIGITPVRSIVLDATRRKLEQRLYLFYSNHTPADAPFLQELEDLKKKNSQFTLVPCIDTTLETWKGETGFIDAAMIKRHCTDVASARWYMSGPPAMVKAMRTVLRGLKVAEEKINAEEFAGY